MVYKFFDKMSTSLADKSKAVSSVVSSNTLQNKQLAEELQKPIIRNFKKRLKDNIWGS